MSHVQSAGVNFDQRMARAYMARMKKAVKQRMERHMSRMVRESRRIKIADKRCRTCWISTVDSTELDFIFTMLFSNGQVHRVRLNEHRFYQSFYSRKEVYEVAEPPACALLDIVLAKGGPEAIAESYYNLMRSQQQSGGQSNETLARRTKVNWCLSSLMQCEGLIKEAVTVYHSGDDVIKAHEMNTFFSGRAKAYFVSKVVDRHHGDRGRYPFLAGTY